MEVVAAGMEVVAAGMEVVAAVAGTVGEEAGMAAADRRRAVAEDYAPLGTRLRFLAKYHCTVRQSAPAARSVAPEPYAVQYFRWARSISRGARNKAKVLG
jgi:hypothetical protein